MLLNQLIPSCRITKLSSSNTQVDERVLQKMKSECGSITEDIETTRDEIEKKVAAKLAKNQIQRDIATESLVTKPTSIKQSKSADKKVEKAANQEPSSADLS